MTFTFIDLFSGIGGFHLACASAGGRLLLACDRDADVRAIYEANYGAKVHDDIRTAPVVKGADLLCAGPPCQAFSSIGEGAGTRDARGALIYVLAKYILDAKPLAFIVENVKGLVSRPAFKRFIARLAPEYDIAWDILDAADFGVPQHRDRVYIIGMLRTQPDMHAVLDGFFASLIKKPTPRFSDIADPTLDRSLISTKFDEIIETDGLLDIRTPTGFILRARKNNYINNKLFSSHGIIGTMCATFIPIIYDERHNVVRRLSVREMAVCQGFPATFKFRGAGRTAISHHLGNAVCVNVVKALVKRLHLL